MNRSGTVGILANPAAGKDVRRLVTHASPTSDAAKTGVVRRAVLGAIGGGAARVLIAPDRHNIATRAVDELSPHEIADATIEILDEPVYGFRGDTTAMAGLFAKADADAVIVLGGDGTNRDVAKGWQQVPLIPISTGTNNVFPRPYDATVAGLAAGLIASGAVALNDDVSHRAKVIHVQFGDGSPDDLALVDVAVVDSLFAGSRAVWDPTLLRALIACIAEPASVGLSSVAGVLQPVDRRSAGGTFVAFARDGDPAVGMVRALLAPGTLTEIPYARCAFIAEGEAVSLVGPAMLAFDGERDRTLDAGEAATAQIRPDGPTVIDVAAVITLAARSGFFHSSIATTPKGRRNAR